MRLELTEEEAELVWAELNIRAGVLRRLLYPAAGERAKELEAIVGRLGEKLPKRRRRR